MFVREIVKSNGDKLEDVLAFRGDVGEAVEAGTVVTAGFDEREVFEFANELTGGEGKTVLAELALKEAVGEQGQHIDEEHGSDALIVMKVNGRDLEVVLADEEAFFAAVLVPVKLKHLLGCKRCIVCNQKIAAIEPFLGR